ncbi:MAG: Ig-like domain repeat protein, partial [Thermoplasmata archaeon]|nr:Ig-like domain repeat protein [Thermoplasmata archaeon]
TMEYDEDSGKFYYEQSYSKLGTYSFTIWAKDSSDNWNYSSGSFVIHDTTPPEISDVDASPDPQEVHGDVNITADVTDNFNLTTVKVEITDPDGTLVGNFTMGFDSDSGKYYYQQSYSKLGTYSFTIWAKDSSDNWNSSSGSFVIHDTTPPTISDVDASPDPQEVHGDVNITADVSDNFKVNVVKVVITDPDGTLVGNFTMEYDSDSGKYYYEQSYSKLGEYTFTIWANDTSDNWNSSSGSFVMQDTTPPTISDVDASPNPQEVHGDVNITADVSDNFKVSVVKVVVTDPDGNLVGNFTMEYDSDSGKYYYEQSYSKLGTYSFVIWANDTSDNWNSSSGSFVVHDTTPPTISDVDASPNPQEVHGDVNITADVSDNFKVSVVKVVVTDPDGTVVGNFTMEYDSDTGKFYYEQSYSKLGTYSFTIWANDTSDNWNSASGTFAMQDTTPPTIEDVDASPDPQKVHENVNITANVTDNFNLSVVKVVILDPDGELVGNFTMEYDSDSGKFYYENAYSKPGTYSFTIWANDTSDNWNSTTSTFYIYDASLPTIEDVLADPDPQETGGEVNVSATIKDDGEVYGAWIEIYNPLNVLIGNFSMDYDSDSDKYYYESSYSLLGEYLFTIWANDTSNNWNYSSGSFVIHDTTPPTISDIDASPDPQEVHGNVNITANVDDNYEVDQVKVEVTDPDGALVGNFTMEYDSDSGKYYYEQSYSKLGEYTFTIWANDTSDNWNYSSGSFIVHDTTPPTIEDVDASPDPQEVHGDVNITATVTDNFEVSVVKVVITDPDGTLVGNFTMEYDSDSGKFYYEQSYSKLGTYSFTIWANDTSDNWNYSSGTFVIHDTTPPEISDVDASPDPQEVHGDVNITADVTDNFNLTTVKVVITDPDGTLVGNFTMEYDSGSGKFYYEQSYSKLGTYSFTIWAKDSSDNWNYSSGTFVIHDTTPPEISDVDASPDPQEVHGDVNIT